MKRYIIIILGIIIFSSAAEAQRNNCRKFHLYAECNANPGPRFKYDGQSRSNIIGVGDQLIYNLVFYSDRQYSLSFCTSEYFEPIHLQLLDADSEELLYDNSADEFRQTLTLNVDYTQRIKILVEIKAESMTEEEKLEYLGCLGMMIQYKKE